VVAVNERAAQNSNGRSGAPSAPETSPAGNTGAPTSDRMMGEPVDTSRFDLEIKRLDTQAKRKPTDQALRRALAAAYMNRADALLKARQYRVALGDYRRVLKYDPENSEAKKWSAEITQIMRGMGREVPAPGTEPTPLPYKT